MYVQLGVAGLRALENYNLEDCVCLINRIIYHLLTKIEMGTSTQ
jgi:hypothetical protein